MNRLAAEASPYLRQHADNPVDWFPWGDEAFEVARTTDRPVLLSIGYSACHWCHVMAHESFEDPETASVVNERFVAVKVDREERPDVDAVYMEAVQAMTGSGGWPLTAFLLPDGKPFFTGTYFPRHGTHGHPSFLDVCRAVDDAWRNRRDELEGEADRITAHLKETALTGGGPLPGPDLLAAARDDLLRRHDTEWGGFGGAPKFPQTMAIDLLLRRHARQGDPEALAAAVRSLDAMAAGGIHDHVGGGFARYAVDRRWLVPHFEKMLYDQALLGRVYLHAWQLTHQSRHLRVLRDLVGYVLRDLRHPSGGFHAAEDADSEGEEGRFYVWTPAQLREVLGDGAEEAMAWWGVTDEGNFEGATIVNRLHGGRPDAGPEPSFVAAARAALLEARSRRVRPGLDDKVLTEWNGLMIATLAEAGAAVDEPSWIDAAVAAADHLLARHRDDTGRWLRSWQDDGHGGRARHLATAVDVAALVDAFTRLAEATGTSRWIDEASTAADQLLARFWDHDDGGLFTTAHDGEQLVTRAKDLLDTATPSANSLAAVALLRLAALTGNDEHRDRALQIVALLAPVAERHAGALGHLLAAVDLAVHGLVEVAVVGDRPDLVAVVRSVYRPDTVLTWGEPYDSPLWAHRAEGQAYVCHDFTCRRPATTPDELRAQLDPAPPPRP
jgi:uncharacterized protein YyaL (SSP411 family)